MRSISSDTRCRRPWNRTSFWASTHIVFPSEWSNYQTFKGTDIKKFYEVVQKPREAPTPHSDLTDTQIGQPEIKLELNYFLDTKFVIGIDIDLPPIYQQPHPELG